MKITAALGATALLASGAYARPHKPSGCAATKDYHGWSSIKYAFVFGDSYTTTGFNYTLTAPSPSNPLGNPTYPGWTSSNGPNWVGYLTTKYNASLLQTYNLAYGGATVDSDLVKPYMSTVLSLKQQVEDEFATAYVPASKSASAPAWTSANSLFAVWIGINDVGNTYGNGAAGSAAINEKIFAVYHSLLVDLHSSGARNFVLLNVPPVDRSPLTVGQGASSAALEKDDIAQFNGMIADMAKNLKQNLTGANFWLYDANTAFGKVLDNPKSFPQTSGYKNTTAYCEAYQNGTPERTTFNTTCGVPVNEYFWLNSLHPTYPMHDVVAQGVTDTLKMAPNVC